MVYWLYDSGVDMSGRRCERIHPSNNMWTSRHRSINERRERKKNLKKKRRSQFIHFLFSSRARGMYLEKEVRGISRDGGETFLWSEGWVVCFSTSSSLFITGTLSRGGSWIDFWHGVFRRHHMVLYYYQTTRVSFFPERTPNATNVCNFFAVVACWRSIMRTDRLTPCNLLSTYRKATQRIINGIFSNRLTQVHHSSTNDKKYVLRTT